MREHSKPYLDTVVIAEHRWIAQATGLVNDQQLVCVHVIADRPGVAVDGLVQLNALQLRQGGLGEPHGHPAASVQRLIPRGRGGGALYQRTAQERVVHAAAIIIIIMDV